jgi:hypothetical protein
VVAFGLSTLLKDLKLVETNAAFLVLVFVGLLDSWLLYRFFSRGIGGSKEQDPPYDRLLPTPN